MCSTRMYCIHCGKFMPVDTVVIDKTDFLVYILVYIIYVWGRIFRDLLYRSTSLFHAFTIFNRYIYITYTMSYSYLFCFDLSIYTSMYKIETNRNHAYSPFKKLMRVLWFPPEFRFGKNREIHTLIYPKPLTRFFNGGAP